MPEDELPQLIRRGRNGDGDAQFRLGCHWDAESGDFEQARYWYQLAARRGISEAAWNLALMYCNGEGGAPDMKQALRYYIISGKAGDSQAWYEAALLLDYENPGVTLNHTRANRYYRLAADAGHAAAACNLGSNLHDGIGARRDFRQSFYYTRLAVTLGDTLALHQLGQDYSLGHGTRRNYVKAFDCFRRSWLATRGATAAGWLGDCYWRGRGVKRNLRKAFLWLKRGAALGDERSTFEVGMRLVIGAGCPRNPGLAQVFLRRYLEMTPEDCDALYWLGMALGENSAEASALFRRVFQQDPERWSAYRIVRSELARQKTWTPGLFREQEALLRYAVRRGLPEARRLWCSKRWRVLRERMTREVRSAET